MGEGRSIVSGNVAAALVVGLASLASGTGVWAVGAQDGVGVRKSVWDRVYTEAQAARGETVYARQCESCHGTGLDGDAATEIPALAGDTFMQRWNGRTLDDVFSRMVRSMPQMAPGSLTKTEYADLVAFVLKANQFPAGFEALGTDSERLRLVVFERAPR